MDSYEMPEPDEAIVERVLMRWGLAGFAVGLVVLCTAIVYVSHRLASILFPGA